MYERDAQAVLRCGQCNKPFDKQSTLKRHGYYCRSRKAGSTHRARSCISCARKKGRCDNRRPECSRCIDKAIECHYPANTHIDAESAERQNTAPAPVVNSPGAEIHQGASNDDNALLDSALAVTFADLGEFQDWNGPQINFADFLNPQTFDESVEYTSSGSSSLFRHSTSSTEQTSQVQRAISSLNASIPPTPSMYTRRALMLRPNMMTGTKRTANLILHTLKSYPQMMLRDNTLPPFIHPRLISSDEEDDQMEPLSNCISLVHMISSGVKGSRKLFWKNVRMECERLRVERLNRWGLLAAMQALSIYILIRLCEGETDHNNFDVLLLGTVTIIAKQVVCSDTLWTTQSALVTYGLETAWKEWLFAESNRRLAVVYRVLDMLVHFEPAALCERQNDLILAPLPAKKELWEAGDELVWKAKSEQNPEGEVTFALAANGELVKLEDYQSFCSDTVLHYEFLDAIKPPRNTAHWEEWCSGMDGFGSLVMLAASLVG